MDDVGVALRRFCLPGPYLLEAQVVPHEPPLPGRIHCYGVVLHLRHRVIHRLQDCAASCRLHVWHFCCAQPVCLPVKVRLYELGAIPVWWLVGIDPVRAHVGVLPLQQQGRARLRHCLRPDLLWLHLG